MKTEILWGIAHKTYGIYPSSIRSLRRDAIADYVKDSRWLSELDGLNDADAWRMVQSFGNRAVKIEVSEVKKK